MSFSEDRELRRKKRKLKKRKQTIITLTILVIMVSVGVVSAQTQGYELFYNDESLGYVSSKGIFDHAVEEMEAFYRDAYGIEDIVIGEDIKLVSSRVEGSLDIDECMQKLIQADVEIYTNGIIVLCDDQVMGTMASRNEAERVEKAYSEMYPYEESLVFLNKTTTLSGTADFATVLKAIKEVKNN